MISEIRRCSVVDCGKKHIARGWCDAHYSRWKKHGDPLGGQTVRGEPRRFLYEVAVPYDKAECLIWPYARTDDGYGKIWPSTAHRIACEELNGPPPTPYHEAAHSCGMGRNGCVAGNHLSWKTRLENQADRIVHGTTSRGEKAANAKLTEEKVREIRGLIGKKDHVEIAKSYSVHPSVISRIASKKTWGWLQ